MGQLVSTQRMRTYHCKITFNSSLHSRSLYLLFCLCPNHLSHTTPSPRMHLKKMKVRRIRSAKADMESALIDVMVFIDTLDDVMERARACAVAQEGEVEDLDFREIWDAAKRAESRKRAEARVTLDGGTFNLLEWPGLDDLETQLSKTGLVITLKKILASTTNCFRSNPYPHLSRTFTIAKKSHLRRLPTIQITALSLTMNHSVEKLPLLMTVLATRMQKKWRELRRCC